MNRILRITALLVLATEGAGIGVAARRSPAPQGPPAAITTGRSSPSSPAAYQGNAGPRDVPPLTTARPAALDNSTKGIAHGQEMGSADRVADPKVGTVRGGTMAATVRPGASQVDRQIPPQAGIRGGHGPYRVWATREGLIGGTTATGHVIRANDIFVALPSRTALHRTVTVQYTGRRVTAVVLDVGPHNVADPYWQTGQAPKAARGIREPGMGGAPKNKAGIDLSDGLWDALGIDRSKGIVEVTWNFEE